jgi:hypothetical protein
MDPGLALLGLRDGWKLSIGRPSAAEARRSQPGIGSWTSPPSRPAQNLPTRSTSRQSIVISCRRNDTTNVIIESAQRLPQTSLFRGQTCREDPRQRRSGEVLAIRSNPSALRAALALSRSYPRGIDPAGDAVVGIAAYVGSGRTST